jgi:hypothetical protein
MARSAAAKELVVRPREQLTVARNEFITQMDGGPLLSPTRIKKRYAAIREQAKIGLARTGEPTTSDNGLLAIPTGNENPARVWKNVESGEESVTYVLNAGSTNWEVSRAEKNEDGSISKKRLKKVIHPDDQERRMTVNQFIDIMVDPIVAAYRERADTATPDDAINIAVKFGFPHRNEVNEERTDAIIIDVKKGGKYSKNWRFTDLDEGQEVNVTELMTERLREQGVNVASVVAKNDTNAVAMDENAAQRALAQRKQEIEEAIVEGKEGKEVPPELIVLDAGFVGGGGTNGAAKGGINLEIGRAVFAGEEDGEVHKKMIEMGLVEGDKIAEQETGAIIVSRIAATLALLDDKYHVLDGGRKYAENLLEVAKDDQKIVDSLAEGIFKGKLAISKSNPDIAQTVQDIAQGEMLRAGVNYGILIANTIAASPPDEWHDQTKQYGLRCEGSVLLNGWGIKDVAVQVAQDLLGLRYAPELIEADGDLGVASLAMSKKQLALAS